MKIINKYILIILPLVFICCASTENTYVICKPLEDTPVVGAAQFDEYLPLLRSKAVGVVANHTSMVGNLHLVDTLLKRGVDVVKAFGPEHGFRGTAGPGDHVQSDIDAATGIRIISLYGDHKKPTAEDVKGLDVMIFDIQDVGARFYTYISTLFYVMEACAENNIPLIVLDRPNPNGFYVDGPLLEPEFRSFVGICPIPVVHGLTVAEFAQMVNGEGWLKSNVKAELHVIKVKNYDHSVLYELPVAPSPNLPDMESVYLYPTLCFFEGTVVSVGRGTTIPFKTIGYPGMLSSDTSYTPVDIPGVVTNPPYRNEMVNGIKLDHKVDEILSSKQLDLDILISTYNDYPAKEKFFKPFFDKLAGTTSLREQMQQGLSSKQIRDSWRSDLDKFRKISQKYVLYK